MESLQPEPKLKTLSPKQKSFCDLVLSGKTQAESYIVAYNKPYGFNLQTARACAQKIINQSLCQSYIKSQNRKAEKKVALSLEDRFRILSEIATDENNSPDTRIRAIDTYSKHAGDTAAQKLELTGKDGNPITFAASPQKPLTVKEKIEQLRMARELRKANETVDDVPLKKEHKAPEKALNNEKDTKEGNPASHAPMLQEGSKLPLVEIESYIIHEKTTQNHDEKELKTN